MDKHSTPGRTAAAFLSLIAPGLGQLWRQGATRAAFFVGLCLLGWLIPLAIIYAVQGLEWLLVTGLACHLAAAVDALCFDERDAVRRREERRQRRKDLHRPQLP